jgi:hypothetical protein
MNPAMIRHPKTIHLVVCALAFATSGSAHAAMIVVNDDNTDWTAIAYPIVTTPDDPNDHQTGISEGDIVGNNTGDPAVLTNFDDNGTPTVFDDGYIGFRVRVGEDKPPAGFTSFFGVGMDANTDGDIDLFLAVDNQPSGGGNQIGIFNPGAGLNTSPDTTTIITTPLVSYAENDPIYDNYDFSGVTTIDPLETNTDLDGAEKRTTTSRSWFRSATSLRNWASSGLRSTRTAPSSMSLVPPPKPTRSTRISRARTGAPPRV